MIRVWWFMRFHVQRLLIYRHVPCPLRHQPRLRVRWRLFPRDTATHQVKQRQVVLDEECGRYHRHSGLRGQVQHHRQRR